MTINRDAHGNALGGVRTPLVDVPIADLRGDGNGDSSQCFLSGSTVPFDAATITALYPTHADYVSRFDNATPAAVKAGFILGPEAKNLGARPRARPSAHQADHLEISTTASVFQERPPRCARDLCGREQHGPEPAQRRETERAKEPTRRTRRVPSPTGRGGDCRARDGEQRRKPEDIHTDAVVELPG